MKKILLFMSALAMLAAASCNKVEINEPQTDIPSVNESVESLEFVAYTETETKTTLNGLATEWERGDEISINGVNYITYDQGNKAIFGKYSEEDANPVAPYYAAYPYAYVSFRNVEGCSFTVLMRQNLELEANHIGDCVPAVAYSESEPSLHFQNVASLVKFQVPATDEPVTEIRISATEELAGEIFVDQTGEVPTWYAHPDFTTYTELILTTDGNFDPEATYYVPVLPGKKTNLTVTINEKVVATGISIEFKRNVIHNLGTLPFVKEPTETKYGVVGSFQAPTTWDVAAPVKMLDYGDGWAVAKDVELYKSDEFKFVSGTWDDPNFGISEVKALEENVEIDAVQGGQNMKVSKNGKYNLYLKLDEKKVKVECVEPYTDLMVTITIDNKANWNPLYITLKDGDTVIADNATVTDNKYQISGEYIGSTLTCTLSNGTKTSEVMNIAITKTGATVTLEETIIKLKVQLNTDNAKQWWGNTMKIHVWNTGTSFDTTWPGNTMTSEGNYTWSIIVPSELAGKTINFLVHNGNGWQSSDSKVTINAEGNTVTGSSIGIN